MRRTEIRLEFGQRFAQQKRLVCQPFRPLIFGKEIYQLVAENTGAAWLQHHEGYACVDLGAHPLKYVEQVFASLVQEAKIVQRAPTADMLCGELHFKAG